MGLVKKGISLIAALSALSALSCGKEPLLTNLETNQLLLIIKGTYESNSPMPWTILSDPACAATGTRPDGTVACNQYTADHLTFVQDDSVIVVSGTDAGIPFGKDDTHPGVFMIDIAEMVLMDYHGKKHKFSNYRQTYAFPLDDGDPVFNGTGYFMENDDVPSKPYAALGIYVRKMLIDSARSYSADSSGWKSSLIWDVFSENELPSFNFNKYQLHSFYDTLRLESIYLNRVYPMIIPISDLKGLIFSNKFPLTVLEIRIIVKNFIKKFEVASPGGGSTNVIHFYGFSDWLQDVQVDDADIGGNMLTVARWYIPGFTGSITGTAGGNDAHVIAIPHDPAHLNISQYTIPFDPYTGTHTSGSLRTNNPANLPRGPAFSLGVSIQNMVDYNLKSEKFKFDWNQKVPSVCPTFDFYKNSWDIFSRTACGLKIPELATFVLAGAQYTIENVPPGSYDVYISNRAPRYGELYHDGEFIFAGTADVSVGSSVTPVP